MVHACQTFRRVLFNLVLVEVDLSDLISFLRSILLYDYCVVAVFV